MSKTEKTISTPIKPFALSPKILWGILIVYTILVLYGISVHEPWRDEAQAWLLARDTNLFQLFKTLPTEGHPPLWYLLIMPLAKLGLPYISQNYLAGAIMIAAIYLLLFKSQLPIQLKLTLPFCFFYFYEYSILARSYGLIVFFTAAVIALYPKRFDKPLLFALCILGLFNSHILAFTFALALAVVFIIDARQRGILNKMYPAITTMLIGGLYLLPYLMTSDIASASQLRSTDHVTKIISAIIGATIIDGNAIWGVLLFFIAVSSLFRTTKMLLVFLVGAAGLFYILAYRYNLGDSRHFGVLFTILGGCCALRDQYWDDKWNLFERIPLLAYTSWSFVLMIGVQIPQTLGSYRADVEQPFSGAKEAAEYIMDNNFQNNIIAGGQAWALSAIAPYLPGKKMYYAECGRYGTYYVYDSCFLQNRWAMTPEGEVDMVFSNLKDSLGKILLVFNRPLDPKALQFMDMVYHSPDVPIKRDEAFFIYRFKAVLKQ